jgi:hypothetical protein
LNQSQLVIHRAFFFFLVLVLEQELAAFNTARRFGKKVFISPFPTFAYHIRTGGLAFAFAFATFVSGRVGSAISFVLVALATVVVVPTTVVRIRIAIRLTVLPRLAPIASPCTATIIIIAAIIRIRIRRVLSISTALAVVARLSPIRVPHVELFVVACQRVSPSTAVVGRECPGRVVQIE